MPPADPRHLSEVFHLFIRFSNFPMATGNGLRRRGERKSCIEPFARIFPFSMLLFALHFPCLPQLKEGNVPHSPPASPLRVPCASGIIMLCQLLGANALCQMPKVFPAFASHSVSFSTSPGIHSLCFPSYFFLFFCLRTLPSFLFLFLFFLLVRF